MKTITSTEIQAELDAMVERAERQAMKNQLYLYHISQTVNNGYDTYDSAVVAAPDEQTAQNMHPGGSELARLDTWAAPSDVRVRLLGKAAFKGDAHVICASFNAV